MNVIDETAQIADTAMVINSRIGKNCMVGRFSRFCYSEMGDYSYVSEGSHVFSSTIERFTSISWNVSIGPANHDYRRISQHSMLFASRFGMIRDASQSLYQQYEGEVHIGNDVWIGCGATVMRGVNVGDGAVIGGGSFVSKDVPPYAIVINNNQILKYRFDDKTIEALLDLKWWDVDTGILKDNIDLLALEMPTADAIREIERKLKGTTHHHE